MRAKIRVIPFKLYDEECAPLFRVRFEFEVRRAIGRSMHLNELPSSGSPPDLATIDRSADRVGSGARAEIDVRAPAYHQHRWFLPTAASGGQRPSVSGGQRRSEAVRGGVTALHGETPLMQFPLDWESRPAKWRPK